MKILDEDIKNVEQRLLPNNCVFDAERVEVIKCLKTKDIKACPGSGKTTVLIAKLMILAERLPFSDGTGICVLTHTNVAIDTIKEKMKGRSDLLFNYPNHFGTFQSFVDKFLAIPAYIDFFGKRPIWIDDEVYRDKAECSFPKYRCDGYSNNENNAAKSWLYKHDIGDIRFEFKNRKIALVGSKKLNFGNESIHRWIKRFKLSLIKKGILTYREAYTLALLYVRKYPSVKKIINNRFKYLFIDEMQDTIEHQAELIDQLFNDSTIIQRFGDPNQSIFHKEVNDAKSWVPNENALKISESKRFGPSIANCIRSICVEKDDALRGNNAIDSLNPHLIVFDHHSKGRVLDAYANIIYKYHLHKLSPTGLKNTFKAVGWVGKERAQNEEHKLNLQSYFEEFKKNSPMNTRRLWFKSFHSYLIKPSYCNNRISGSRLYFERILHALIRILEIAEIKNKIGQQNLSFTPTTLVSFLKKRGENTYEILKQKMTEWILKIQNNELIFDESVFNSISLYVKETFLPIWGNFNFNDVYEFMDTKYIDVEKNGFNSPNGNIFVKNFDGTDEKIEIEIATIHSVKGETHRSTLYLETFYYNYESKKILNFMVGDFNKKAAKKKTIKEALKMAYVGMSRPTHLLCVAMDKERIEGKLDLLKQNGWVTVDITNE